MSLRTACSAVLSCALLFTPPALDAQTPALAEVFEVRVTNVDVVVTDSKGNPVPGLTQDQFEIYEDGKRQDVTNFSEIAAATAADAPAVRQPGAPPPASTARKFILYLDGNSLGLRNRGEILGAMQQFLATNLRAGDQAMIVTWSGSLNVRLPWSGDRAAIEAVLEPLVGEVGVANVLQIEKQQALRSLRQFEKQAEERAQGKECDPANIVTYEQVESQARSYAEKLRYDVSQSVAGMTRLLASLSGVEGRKVLILATEALPTQAGAEIFQAFESIRQRVIATPAPVVTASGNADGPLGTSLWMGSRGATAMSDLGKYNVAPLIEGLGRAANATGVTVYALNPKGTENDAGTAGLQEATEVSVDFAQAVQALDGVNVLATRTGGVAMIGAPAEVALARLASDLGAYYSIGYRPRPGKSAERKMEVKIKRPGASARYRKSIYYRTLDTEMSDHVLANHFQSELPNAMGIGLQADPVTTDGGKRLMPMRVIIPADSLTLLPDAEGNLTGGFSVFTSAGDRNGGTGVDVQTQQIKWPAAQAAQMKGRRIGFAIQVPMERSPRQISVGVVDLVSQVQGFSVMQVQGE